MKIFLGLLASLAVFAHALSQSTKRECDNNDECSQDKACFSGRCEDTCVHYWSMCGPNSTCVTVDHDTVCPCLPGHEHVVPSHYRSGCRPAKAKQQPEVTKVPSDPCKNKCGPQAVCTRVSDYVATCACPADKPFKGDPYDRRGGCQPAECSEDIPCGRSQNCVEHKCVDKPCEGLCGRNTECFVADRDNTLCGCQTGYSGNPYSRAGCPHENATVNFVKCFSENPDRPSVECVEYKKNKPEKKFHIVTEEASWFEAHKHCVTEGKILATIESDKEMTTITNKVIDDGHQKRRFWVAGSNLKTEKRYQWVVGGTFTSMLYTNWDEHEPPAGQPRRCVALSPFQWVTEPQCDHQLPYICQDV